MLLKENVSPHFVTLRPSDRKHLARADKVVLIDKLFETAYGRAAGDQDNVIYLSSIPTLKLLDRRVDGAFSHDDHDDHAHDDHDDHAKHDDHDDHAHDDHDDHAKHDDHDDHAHDDHDDHAKHDDHDDHAHDDHDDHAKHDDHDDHAKHDDHDDHAGHGHESSVDLHLWLSPTNAVEIIKHVSAELSLTYPDLAAQFAANSTQSIAKINALETELKAKLAPVRNIPFIAYHDAYAYFEHDFGLTMLSSILNHHDAPVEIGRIRYLREIIEHNDASCIFHEPQFDPKIIDVVDPDQVAQRGTLDPIGSNLEPGADLYLNLLRQLTQTFVDCLSRSSS